MADSTKISPERIQKRIETLEEMVEKKLIKPRHMYKQMVNLACELTCVHQNRSSYCYNH